ncbi:MAG: hypothetical protein EA376_14570 [Phycisphaeraceae bacterium]|nr:MAG: hypothetical protein EA376_14570 [Phycisphaeraceae bacterium]
MRKMSKYGKGLFIVGVGAVIGFGAIAHNQEATAGLVIDEDCLPGVDCLDVWDPVLCPNGQVYSNFCYAAKACQKGCVWLGGDIW